MRTTSSHHELHVAGAGLRAGLASPLLAGGDAGPQPVVDVEDDLPLLRAHPAPQWLAVALGAVALQYVVNNVRTHLYHRIDIYSVN